MVSSAKHGSHGFVRSLDSSYPSLMASAVGADRFWQIDLGCHRELIIRTKGRPPLANGPFSFLIGSNSRTLTSDLPRLHYFGLRLARHQRVRPLRARHILPTVRIYQFSDVLVSNLLPYARIQRFHKAVQSIKFDKIDSAIWKDKRQMASRILFRCICKAAVLVSAISSPP
jgi:hypothetical protein